MFYRSFVPIVVPDTHQNVPAIRPDRRLCMVPGCVTTQLADILFRRFCQGLSRQVVRRERR